MKKATLLMLLAACAPTPDIELARAAGLRLVVSTRSTCASSKDCKDEAAQLGPSYVGVCNEHNRCTIYGPYECGATKPCPTKACFEAFCVSDAGQTEATCAYEVVPDCAIECNETTPCPALACHNAFCVTDAGQTTSTCEYEPIPGC